MGVTISESIVFFGTGPVAAKSLELLAKNFSIEAVITKPQPSHHRQSAPVIDTATRLGLKTLLVSNKQDLHQLFSTKPVTSKLGVLIDFGIIVPQEIIDYFPLGILNSHFSILPELRGADPITFAILSGQKQTGVSLMLIVEAMDEGPIVSYGEYNLSDDITTPKLTNDLINLSDALLSDALPRIFKEQLKGTPQAITGRSISYSRKLNKADGVIDWNKSAVQIAREIRAYYGWPNSRTQLAGKDITITKAHPMNGHAKPGEVIITKKSLVIGCGTGLLRIERIKPAGKSDMPVDAFLAGYGSLLQGKTST